MNAHPIPAVALPTTMLAAIARLRAECTPWIVLVEQLEIPDEFRQDIDLLPLFHLEWQAIYIAAHRQSERDAYSEAQLVTRRLMKYGKNPAHRLAALKRVGARPARRGAGPTSVPPLVVVAGNALAFRLSRGETLESISASYWAGLNEPN